MVLFAPRRLRAAPPAPRVATAIATRRPAAALDPGASATLTVPGVGQARGPARRWRTPRKAPSPKPADINSPTTLPTAPPRRSPRGTALCPTPVRHHPLQRQKVLLTLLHLLTYLRGPILLSCIPPTTCSSLLYPCPYKTYCFAEREATPPNSPGSGQAAGCSPNTSTGVCQGSSRVPDAAAPRRTGGRPARDAPPRPVVFATSLAAGPAHAGGRAGHPCSSAECLRGRPGTLRGLSVRPVHRPVGSPPVRSR